MQFPHEANLLRPLFNPNNFLASLQLRKTNQIKQPIALYSKESLETCSQLFEKCTKGDFLINSAKIFSDSHLSFDLI